MGSAEDITPASDLTAETQTASTHPTRNGPKDMASFTASPVGQALQTFHSTLQELRQDFETKIKYDESKERVINSLHSELQSYRDGLHFKILRPLFIDLIAMYDDLGRLIEEGLETHPRQVTQNLITFQETIEEMLRRNGVEIFQCEGETFLSNKQRILHTVTTPDPTQDRLIARRVRKGFLYEERVIRPEIVELYKYIAIPASTS